MDTSLAVLAKLVADLGLVGLVIYLWWADKRQIWAVIEQHKKEMAAVLAQYQQDMAEQREMYRSNASLCHDYESIASDLRDIVSLNIQKMTQVDEAIRQNLFCPVMRIRKEKTIKLVPGSEGGGG
jgi:hypothetical protein